MTNLRVVRLAGVLWMALSALNAQSVNPAVTVPRTVRYTGSFRPVDGLPVQPTEGVTVAVYADQTGGDALWQETQNVLVDASGNFAMEMGATQNGGLPLDLLRTGEPRWLGVRVNRPGENEQPRVQLLSVPYALRASDSETLGGLPSSAYLLNPSATLPSASSATATAVASAGTGINAKTVKPHVTSGNTNFIGMFTNTTDLGNSVMFQNGTKIGVNTVNPQDFMHVAFNDPNGTFTGYAVQNLSGSATAFSGMLFYDQNGALTQFQGFNNSTHEYRINNIASNASINFMLGFSSKFQVQPSGDINIAGSIRRGNTLFLHNLGTNNTALGLNALSNNTTGVENTAIGSGVLQSNTTGGANTAIGFQSLISNTTGGGNTALGWGAMPNNTTANQNTAVGQTALNHNTTGDANTAVGANTLQTNTTGTQNTAVGMGALQSNTTGASNTASGTNALLNNTTGNFNTAIGGGSLSNNTTGGSNTASGDNALQANTTGGNNTANGANALQNNTTGNSNTATGLQALQNNTIGSDNTASGESALASNTTGSNNTATGFHALNANTASGNTATGFQSLQANTSGTSNTASGANALISNTTGSSNTASGNFALNANTTGNSNTALGFGALSNNTTGSGNIALGSSAGQNISTGSNNIIIGNNGTGSDSTTIRIGSAQTATFIAGISGRTTGNNNAVTVVIDSNGQLGTINSSRRFKEDIQDMGDASSNLLRLRPVTYRYKQPYADGSKPLDYGLIAEEVAEVYPDLVARNQDGEIQTVQYQRLTPMLLNELQKQDETIRSLKEQIRQQQIQNEKLDSRLMALETLMTGGKVSNATIAAR